MAGHLQGLAHRGRPQWRLRYGGGGRVLSQALDHRDPLSVNAFTRSHGLGPIDCRVELLRHGATPPRHPADVPAGRTAGYRGSPRLSELALGETWSAKPRLYPLEDCTPSGQDGWEFFRERVEIRPGQRGRGVQPPGAQRQRRVSGLDPPPGQAAPDPSLLMFADAFAPPAFTIFGPLLGYPRWN